MSYVYIHDNTSPNSA